MKKLLFVIAMLTINAVAMAQKSKANRTPRAGTGGFKPLYDSLKQIQTPANTNQSANRSSRNSTPRKQRTAKTPAGNKQ